MPALPGLDSEGNPVALNEQTPPEPERINLPALPGIGADGEPTEIRVPREQLQEASRRRVAADESLNNIPVAESIPGTGPLIGAARSYLVRQAKARVEAGKPEAHDYDLIARDERLKELASKRGIGGTVAPAIPGMLGMAVETAVAGPAIGAARS